MRVQEKYFYQTVIATAFFFIITSGSFAQAENKYSATFYVAGMGGHFAKAEVEIDPGKEKAPLTLKSLEKLDIGDNKTHPTHDARIDVNDNNTMFWSTYKMDESEEFANTRIAHVGKSDLRTGEVIQDMIVDVPHQATVASSLYCASAQTKNYYLPISMSNKGYIDVFNKSDLKRTQRVFLEGTEADIKAPYRSYHGVNSPDFKKLLISINEADSDHGQTIGKIHLIELDMEKFVKGEVKVLNKSIAPGTGRFISFRQYYSPDGSLIANSAGNSMLLIDSKTLKVIDHERLPNLTENHDAIFTPDGKYVILTSRTKALLPNCEDPQKPKSDEFIMDGHLLLYDVEKKQLVGESISVCATCHKQEDIEQHAVLCGLDAVFN